MTKRNAPETCPYRAYQITQTKPTLIAGLALCPAEYVAYYDGGTADGQPAEAKALAVAQWMGLPNYCVRHLLGTSICYIRWQKGQKGVKMPTGKVVKG